MMPYFFGALSHPHRLEFLDYCQKLGLKVMVPLGVNVPYTADPVKHAWFVSNITALRYKSL
jgi:hypothetical protein